MAMASMDDLSKDYGAEAILEMTLPTAINRLNEVSRKLYGTVFGEGTANLPSEKTPLAGSKIIESRNSIQEITKRLEEVLKALDLLGKWSFAFWLRPEGNRLSFAPLRALVLLNLKTILPTSAKWSYTIG